jgi:pimeloyl-ACP methyl ester carboxylesterase
MTLPRFAPAYLLLSVVATSASCSWIRPPRLNAPAEHVLIFDTQGQVADPTGNISCVPASDDELCHGRQWSLRGQRPLTEQQFARYTSNILSEMRQFAVREASEGRSPRLLLFVHGGLNPRAGSLGRADRLAEQIEREARAYPLFVNWRSSFRSTYFEHLLYLRQGKNLGLRATVKAPFYLAGDLARGAIRIPVSWWDEVRNARRASPGVTINPWIDQVAEELEAQGQAAGMQFWAGEDCSSKALNVGRALSLAVTLPTSKSLVALLLEGPGESSWDVMLRRATLLFFTEDELRKEAMVPSKAGSDDPQGDLFRFLREAAKFFRQEQAEGRQWTVDLIGHSMGAIVANYVLLTAGDSLPIGNVVHMAPAGSLEDLLWITLPYVDTHPDVQMYQLMLHPKAELREAHGWDTLPRGSLLVWLDDFFTNPGTPLARRSGRTENFLRIAHLIPERVRPRIHAKSFSVGGCADVRPPAQHGEFGSVLRFWRSECWDPANEEKLAYCFNQKPLPEEVVP